MSSLDLSDEHISMAYDALAQNNPLRWFLIAYSNKPNQLILCASGTGDIEDLRSHLTPGNVHYGLFREQSLHVALSYIPDAVSGVKRARALVHARVVSSKFKAHQVLNVSNLDQITVDALRSALRLPPRDSQRSALLGLGAPPRSFSISRQPTSDMRSASLSTSPGPTNSETLQAHPRSTSSPLNLSSGMQASDLPAEVFPAHPEETMSDTDLSTPSNMQGPITSHLADVTTAGRPNSPQIPGPLGAQALQSAFSAPSSSGSGLTDDLQMPPSPLQVSWLAKQETPLPPPPPEDPDSGPVPEERRGVEHGPNSSDERPSSLHIGSIPDSQSVASRDSLLPTPPSPSPLPPHPTSGLSPAMSNGTPPRSPERRLNYRVDGLSEASLSSPFSEQLDSPPRTESQNETFHQRSNQGFQNDGRNSPSQREDPPDIKVPQRTRSRFQPRRVVSAADEEEERRLAILDEERRRRAAERAKREKQEREEEEARQHEFEERKERDKKRRWELARKAEERRIEQQQRQEEEERRRKEETARKEEEVRERRSHIQRRFEKHKGLDLLSGFITLESSSNWKRRYFRLSTEDWVFFKSDKEITHPVHAIELRHVRGLREWNEGYEELEAIPHSFAVELEDGTPCLFFADSAEDKEVLLGLLNQAAGL